MLLKTISALASIALLATSATAHVIHWPYALNKSPKLGVLPIRNKVLNGSDAGICSNAPPLDGPISNGGGSILKGNVKFYYIFYGNWTKAEKSILIDFGNTIGGSHYSNIETTYGATGNMTFADSIDDNYSLGTSLGENGVLTVVKSALGKGLLPVDPNAVYFVLSSPDVTEGDFCGAYCGYHYWGSMENKTIAYSFVGNPANCMQGCGGCNQDSSPNGNPGVDSMVSVLTHELMEAISDPHGDAWRDENGYENADKCAWNYGTSIKKGHYFYNIVLGKRKFLIQQNWNAKTQGCAMSVKKEK